MLVLCVRSYVLQQPNASPYLPMTLSQYQFFFIYFFKFLGFVLNQREQTYLIRDIELMLA